MTTKPETAVRSWQNFLTMAVGAGVGYGMLAAVVYMGLMLFGWSKSGLVGDFLVGFGAGALADELLSSGVMGGS